MYTDTTSPNHLVMEVIDNSVDEALAGYAKEISVILNKDFSVSVEDDGRGMPVDIHPEEKVPGVELIFSRLHAGAKFSNKDYVFFWRPSRCRRFSCKCSFDLSRCGNQTRRKKV